MFDFIKSLFVGMDQVIIDVLTALSPILLLFVLAHFIFLKYKKKRIITIIKGLVITVLGLIIFLQGVQNGFTPVAEEMGKILVGKTSIWVIPIIGFLFGISITLADPAIYVLVQETDKASGGAIKRKMMFITLCLGVGMAMMLTVLRLIFDINILWIIVPGYIVAITLSFFVESDFSSLAFDSGSVVTGTMIASFILPLIIGIASGLGRDPQKDAFGVVGTVALTPILIMLILGVLVRKRNKE
ncbi:MAG TPA: DUF1538 domain-containing protein [Acholeplasmataceae bacterium]|jgi:hypothetical protein|nr:DUF1538 domain-containing protein [Acholeplasmataceae bacterium]